MATAPQILTRDGSYTQNLVLTTNVDAIFLTGTVEASTVDVQISINGGAFVSDPTLVSLNGTNFQIPNPASYPNGLTLVLGFNTIQLRAIDIVGGVSPVSTAQITRVFQVAGADTLIPTGIRLRRRRDSVSLLASKPDTDGSLQFVGFNFYASTASAGTTGRYRINLDAVTEVTTQEEDLVEINTNTSNFTSSAGGVALRTVVTEEDAFGQTLSTISNRTVPILGYTPTLRFEETYTNVITTEFISFLHNRSAGASANTVNSDQFVDVANTAPLYYTVTAIYYDPAQLLEFETPHSQEVLGSPLIIDTNIRDLPGRSHLQIVTDYISAVRRINTEVSLIPGSVPRDVDIDPFASEAERIWFVIDFVHRSQSFVTLLQIDDANNDGVSDPVTGSAYKQALKAALGFQTDDAVQTLIDTQFEKLAANFQKPRLPGRPAVGEVVFYTAVRPSKDIVISSGAVVSTNADADNGLPSIRYLVSGTYVISATDAEAFFNFDTQQYEITAAITAETIGEDGNRPADQIRNIVSGVSGVQVVNREATNFGLSRESNAGLAARAQLGFVSVDTGTEGGYTATAVGTTGVIKTKVVKSGDPYMMRDYDEVRHKHIGGKVDIWIQGLRERTVVEKFSFAFETARDIRCQIVDLGTLTFRVLDSRVTVNTPIVELLDDASQGLGVRNATTGQDYDLAGVIIIDFETFRLDTGITQPATDIDDIITADYRFRSLNQFRFSYQPVRRVTSVVGQSSGPLNIDLGFDLYKTADPLLEGESTISTDYLVINQVGGIPTGATIAVTDEEHVLIGFFEEPLQNVGINVATIAVLNEDRSIEYDGPSSGTPDYEIIPGTATTPVKIVRTSSSTIVSGQPVVVDYVHDENFTVTYVINDLLQQLQNLVNVQRHITADVLVKQAVDNSVNLDTTLQLKRGFKKDTVDPAVRTNVSIELNTKLIGEGIAQSDLINAVDSTTGVDFQVIPLARMGYADGSRKLRESVLSTNTRLNSLDIGGNLVFILTNALQYPTTDGGGLETEHKGVFQDDEAMVLSASLSLVGEFSNQAFILGADGAEITGYSDNATLISEGFVEPEDILEERLRRTANHVVLSLSGSGSPQDNPDQHVYTASYVVREDVGPHDITASAVEFIGQGELTLTIREVTTNG